MSTLFPGSGSTRGTPPKLLPAPYTGTKWVSKYECDFTDSGAANMDWRLVGPGNYASISGGSYSVGWGGWADGSEVEATRAAYASDMKLESGVGIRVTANGSSPSNYEGRDQRAPRVQAVVSQLLPTATTNSTICLQAFGNCTTDPMPFPSGAPYTIFGWGMVLGGPTGYTAAGDYQFTNAAAYMRSDTSSVRQARIQRGDELAFYPGGVPWLLSNYNFFEIIVFPYFSGVQISIGTWGGSFPEPGTQANRNSAVLNNLEGPSGSPLLDITAAAGNAKCPYIGLASWSTRAAEGPQVDYEKFRALILE